MDFKISRICHVGSHLWWRLRNGCGTFKSIIMCTKLLLACTWHSDKVRNGFWIPALLCTVKCNWVIVTGPQSSLSERANSNNQSIIMKPEANWVTLGYWRWNRHRNANPYLQALEWESGWVIMVNWKQALWTIGSCKRIQNAVTLYHLHIAVKLLLPLKN